MAAYTLVELTVAVALTVVILTIVTQVFFVARQVTAGAQVRAEMHLEARMILDLMARDLLAATPEFGLDPADFDTSSSGSDVAMKPFWGISNEYETTRHYSSDGVAFVADKPGEGLRVCAYRLDLDDTTPTNFRQAKLIRYEGPLPDVTATPVEPPLQVSSTDLLDTSAAGYVSDGDLDSANGLDWQTVSEYAVSLQFRYYRDFDYDGYLDEDDATTADDADLDGTADEDPPAVGTYGDYFTQPLDEWMGYEFDSAWAAPAAGVAGWQQFSYWIPAFVEIRLVMRTARDETYRVFSRLVHIPSYSRIQN